MIKTLHGKIHGKTIELDENPGVADGQEVEIQIKVIQSNPSAQPAISPGLAEIYAILGERYSSGCTDTAERHNEHQP